MVDQAKNVLIGVFVLVALAIVVFVLLFLHPSIGDERKVLHVRFANIDKVTLGTRVTFAGLPVGEVVSITELPDALTERKAKNGVVYIYQLTLRVDSSVNVYDSDEISLRTSGLLGEKSVAINPLPPRPGVPLRLVNNEVIYAVETGSVEDTLKEFKNLSGKFELAIDGIVDAFEEIKKQRVIKNLGHTMQNVSEITASINQPKNLSETISNVHELSSRALKTWNSVDETIANINHVFSNGNEIFTRINEGKGTIGKILNNEELYLRLNSLLSKGETIFNDINHYGLLFNMDKGWQRLRARRLNLLTKLRTPQEFKNYFNDEMDQISTSLSRVSMVLEKVDIPPTCPQLFENKEFSKVFAELIRRVGDIEEALRLYNQEVVNTQVHKSELEEPCCCFQ